jgi:hypothetical protein
MPVLHLGETEFRIEREMVDVTSMRRPDTSWVSVDAAQHVHCWYEQVKGGLHRWGRIADTYRPEQAYHTPTLRWVKDGETMYEDDDEPVAYGHFECVMCGARVEPRYTADSHTQYIAGIAAYFINDQPVTKDTFTKRLEEESSRFGY